MRFDFRVPEEQVEDASGLSGPDAAARFEPKILGILNGEPAER